MYKLIGISCTCIRVLYILLGSEFLSVENEALFL